MQVIAVDIGTGTQDIFLYDSDLDMENGYKMVAPSPTMIFHRRIKQATKERRGLVLSGTLMGGGPVSWAANDHIHAGLPLYATPAAARTFNDDLEQVQKTGVILISEDEAASKSRESVLLELKDFDFPMIYNAFQNFGYRLAPDVLALAVFDHGNSPPGYSDRQFRFDYIADRIREENSLSAFAFRSDRIPPIMTRLEAVAQSARDVNVPIMVMDTAPAAVLGATLDPRVQARVNSSGAMVANIGNFHCLVFRLGPDGIQGVFEHHSGEVSAQRLDDLMAHLADGTLTHDQVFNDKGHGALLLRSTPLPIPDDDFGVAVTGPRRNKVLSSRHRPYFAVPFGDMMMAGCFGMLQAMPDVYPELAGPIRQSLAGMGGIPPWELGGMIA